MQEKWFVIINPASGNFKSSKQKQIFHSLTEANINYEFQFTETAGEESIITIDAISLGFRKFISVGGDGTFHHIINGVMNQKEVPSNEIKIAVFPTGTGNDWVRSYNIKKNIKKNISILKEEHTILQDIGKIKLLNESKSSYFHNLAGLGFDGYVVHENKRLKFLGSFSFLITAIFGMMDYKSSMINLTFDDKFITTRSLLTIIGICEYSGGGMKLTKDVDAFDGLFDIAIAKNFSVMRLFINVRKLFNGSITDHRLVSTYKTSKVKITSESTAIFVQADGEILGTGGFEAEIIPKAIQFVVPVKKKLKKS